MGRSHQVLQSVINEESALGPLLGFYLPVAGGSGGLPVARADQVEAVEGRCLGSFDFSVTGYVRRTRGLALGSVSTPGLFPVDSVVVGRGYASGVIGAVELEQGRLSGRAFVTVARDVRTAGTIRYDAELRPGDIAGPGPWLPLDAGQPAPAPFRGGGGSPPPSWLQGSSCGRTGPLRESGELAGTPENLPAR